MALQFPISIRPAIPEDDPIIYDSWARSLADELEIHNLDERRRFVSGHKHIISALLSRSRTLVAASRKDPLSVYGWVCHEGPTILHFVFVKKDFRRGRIATRLLQEAQLAEDCGASHSTFWGFPRVAKLFHALTHDPSLGIPR